ncbi:hypothetical protein PR202_gb16417 [Eleusine coracana subsp. coracana]|uniref:DUF868 family protein n=1 Tax=Eleusine coracana subsp. coracana TaxID=191504 RepID=A0AAV5F0B5_ELECO|nr:hypothetical protein PR202_gb16417 [Eleusine coracana subsp. coracana]
MVSASSLLLPSSVRDLASCVSDGAVRVACTTPASTRITSFSSSSTTSSSSPSNLSVAITYRATRLSPSAPPLLLRLIWSHSPAGPPALSFAPNPNATSSSPVLLRRRKGTRSVPGDTPLALFWDLTAAKYGAASPEPVSGFYVVAVAVADAEVVLAVGDLAAEFVKTKVRFAEDGAEHEVSVGCSSSARPGDEELWVCVDGKRAVTARSLRWNFRGNQTVFVDGAPVDVMWDLHGWWFRDTPGCAVVMLRARSALESRLWLEEEVAAPGFSLVVQAFKSPP